MADDGFTVRIDSDLAGRVKAAAEAAGRSVEDYAADLIASGLDDDWAEDYARYADYKRTGEFIDAETALRDFRQGVAARLAARRR
jgi:predicted transcriptional regulator